MKMFLLLLLFLIILKSSYAIENNYKIEKSPQWKKQIKFEVASDNYSGSGEVSYLLVDWQENEALKEYSYRYCIRLNNENGVQNNSQISLSFDPSYQQLSINKIVLHRGEQVIDQLKREQIDLMRNEGSTDRFIYNGTYSAVVILKDVRVNDILEYEFTLKGQNPIWKGQVYSNFQLVYNEEIKHLYKCSMIPENLDVDYYSFGRASDPVIKRQGKLKIFEWDLKNVAPVFVDDRTPSWYQTYAFCEISSFRDWKQVKQWENELYDFNISTPQIDQFLKRDQFQKTDEGILKIIRFVQDEVRYLGMEMGPYSHKPHDPEKVFEQRFGDCKDKSYLLTLMLRKTGIEAWPAFVSTIETGHVDARAPSPFAFNHVIVKFCWNDTVYWVDPTASQEKGTIEYLNPPPYGKALVLNMDTRSDFEDIPVRKENRIVIHEDIWITDSISDAAYQVITSYYGDFANQRRRSHYNSSLSQTRDQYLSFYSNYYKGIKWKSDSALRFQDFPEINVFKTTEEFLLKKLWEKRGNDSTELYASFYPCNLYEFLSHSDDQDRTSPLDMLFPVSVDYSIRLHFPGYKNISLKNQKDSVINEFFKFFHTEEVDRQNHVYHISYNYEALADHVPEKQINNYFEDYKKMADKCEVSISWGMKDNSFSLFFLALLLCVLVAGLMIIWLIHLYSKDLGYVGTSKIPQPLGGWLWIPVIGLHASPLIMLVDFIRTGYFNRHIWENVLALNPDYAGLMGFFFFFELSFNTGSILFSGFLLLLLYKRRSSFPVLFIWFRLVSVVFLVLDLSVVSGVTGAAMDYSTMTREIIYTCIWVPYFAWSERVQYTFVRPYSQMTSIPVKEEKSAL